MVRLAIELELPGSKASVAVGEVLTMLLPWCEERGWSIVSCGPVAGEPLCPKCGSPMTYSPSLQAYACSHPE